MSRYFLLTPSKQGCNPLKGSSRQVGFVEFTLVSVRPLLDLLQEVSNNFNYVLVEELGCLLSFIILLIPPPPFSTQREAAFFFGTYTQVKNALSTTAPNHLPLVHMTAASMGEVVSPKFLQRHNKKKKKKKTISSYFNRCIVTNRFSSPFFSFPFSLFSLFLLIIFLFSFFLIYALCR